MSFLILPKLKAVVVVADDPRIMAIPGAQEFHDHYAVMPHNVPNSQALRAIGIPVPSPIGFYYDWPLTAGKFVPGVHAKETAGFFTLFKRGYCLNDIGTHKTASALYASDYLQTTGVIRRTLIISPLSTLEQVWADTTYFTFPKKSIGVLYGTAAKRRQIFKENHDWYVINFDGLGIITDRTYDNKKRLVSAKLLRDDIDLIVIDEIGEYRNYDTEKYAILKKVIQPAHWVWGMTATPTPQAPTDAWAQAKLLTPGTVPGHWTAFRDLTMRKVSTFRWVSRPAATGIVASVLQPSIRYERSECYDLPPTTYAGRDCELTAVQKKHFTELMNVFVTEFKSGQKVVAINEGVKISKLLQVVAGVVYDKTGAEVVVDAAPRLKLLDEIITQAGQKVLVFVPFTHALKQVHEYVSKRWTCEMVNGEVSKTKRDDIFMRFQSTPDPHVIVADARTMSHGLTLTKASTIVWYLPAPSSNIYVQANGRIVRSSQVNNTLILHISATKLERKIYARHQTQTAEQGVLLELLRDAISNAN